MTELGENRLRYSEQVEAAPSRFSAEYSVWAGRADTWAEVNA